MKNAYFILLGIVLFISCTDKNPLIGTWIEQDNFINPAIYEIDQDYYKISNDPFSEKRIYKVKKDTFLFDSFFGLDKMRFEVEENRLLFYSAHTDSILTKFERNVYRNFIDYFNQKKNTSIRLPVVESEKFIWDDNLNTIVFDTENNYSVFVNGERFELDSSVCLKLLPTVDDYLFNIYNNLVFCDSRIKLEELNKLKIELQKARRNRITYVTQDSSNNLLGLGIILPYIESNLPDSILSKYPPPLPPPTYNLEHFGSRNILCKIEKNKLLINNKEVTHERLYSSLKENIKTIKGFVAHVYFDEEMDFESYLQELSGLRKVYYSVRNEYSLDKYDEPNYENLELDERREIQNLFPLKIREINKKEYEEIKKYAL